MNNKQRWLSYVVIGQLWVNWLAGWLVDWYIYMMILLIVCVCLLCHKLENVEHFHEITKSKVMCNACCLFRSQLNHKIAKTNNLKQITKSCCGDEFRICHRIYCSLNVILTLSNERALACTHTRTHPLSGINLKCTRRKK